jgi:hypothetical protein
MFSRFGSITSKTLVNNIKNIGITSFKVRSYSKALPLCSNFHPIAQHRDTVDNNAETFFDFTPENYERVSYILLLFSFNIIISIFIYIYLFNIIIYLFIIGSIGIR